MAVQEVRVGIVLQNDAGCWRQRIFFRLKGVGEGLSGDESPPLTIPLSISFIYVRGREYLTGTPFSYALFIRLAKCKAKQANKQTT